MDDKWDKSDDNCNQLKLVGPIGRAVVIIVLLKAKLGSQVSSQLRLKLAFHLKKLRIDRVVKSLPQFLC